MGAARYSTSPTPPAVVFSNYTKTQSSKPIIFLTMLACVFWCPAEVRWGVTTEIVSGLIQYNMIVSEAVSKNVPNIATFNLLQLSVL